MEGNGDGAARVGMGGGEIKDTGGGTADEFCSDPVTNNPNDIIVNKQATSMRQSAEWGMRGFQSSFPRLYDKIKYEENGERKKILSLCFLIYNLRARRVGINQIKNFYMPALEVNVNDMFRT